VSLLVIGVAILDMIGWEFNVPGLTGVAWGLPSMKFVTAISFVLGGLILFTLSTQSRGSSLATIGLPLTTLVMLLLMAPLFASAILGIQTGLESLFVAGPFGSSVSGLPGSPSIGEVLSFILISSVGVLLMFDLPITQRLLVGIGGGVALIGGVAAVGYLARISPLYYGLQGPSGAMPIHSSILFLLIGFSLVFLARWPRQGVLNNGPAHALGIKHRLTILLLAFATVPMLLIGAISVTTSQTLAGGANPGSSAGELLATNLTTTIELVGTVVVIFVALVALATAKAILDPIIRLRKIVERISVGDLDVSIDSDLKETYDEISDLANSFERTIVSLKLATHEAGINIKEPESTPNVN
jgi:HAMP domain-containing protein